MLSDYNKLQAQSNYRIGLVTCYLKSTRKRGCIPGDTVETFQHKKPPATMDAATYEEGFFRHRLLMKLPALSATFLPSENTSRKVPSS